MAATAQRQQGGELEKAVVRGRPVLFAYGLLGIVFAAYAAWVIARDAGSSTAAGGWYLDALELAAAGLVLLRAPSCNGRRWPTLALGGAVAAWAIGDLCTTLDSLGGLNVASNSVANGFHLAFYPLAGLAVVLYARADGARLGSPSLLEGGVAGLGAAALCAAFAFHGTSVSSGGNVPMSATTLAYRVLDLVLVGLVLAATVLVDGERRLRWLPVVAACALNTLGDAFGVFAGASARSDAAGAEITALAWPAALVLVSLTVWVPGRIGRPRTPERAPGFLLPGAFALAALAVVLLGCSRPVEPAALVLATATLLVSGLRMGLSLGALHRLTEDRYLQSLTDDLTGLANRRYLFQVLDRFFTNPSIAGERLAFLFIDLNHFKEVNDSFGHPAGDELLRQIGPRLAPLLRQQDLLVRLGGDELAAVLPGAGESEALAVAQRLANAFEEPFDIGRVRARVGASIGIALAPDHAGDPDRLFRSADVAMYRAKLTHRTFEVYEATLDEDGSQMELVDELRVAVAENQFVLHFQAQLDLRCGEVAAVEALVRWRHPRLGLIPPLKFLPLAEEAGLMPELTEIVLDAALAQCARWHSRGSAITVAVNVSATNLLDVGFTDLVQRLLLRHEVDPDALVLEITETSIISDYDRARLVVDELRAFGVMVSIDDFGAGFTSLAYLGDLAVGELKLDRAFTTALIGEDRGRDRELVRSTINLGHALGLRVVAEGVEDSDTLDLLTSFGCDIVQGYLISAPLPAGDSASPETRPSTAALEATG